MPSIAEEGKKKGEKGEGGSSRQLSPRPKRAASSPKPQTPKEESKNVKKKRGTTPKKRSRSTSPQTTKIIRQWREERKKADKLAKEIADRESKRLKSETGHAGHIICAVPGTAETKKATETPSTDDFFWEVEKVIGRRVVSGRVEYLIRWKGCPEEENTWEPAANLCDTAMSEALAYCRQEKIRLRQRDEDERRLGLLGGGVKAEKMESGSAETEAGENKQGEEGRTEVVTKSQPQDQVEAKNPKKDEKDEKDDDDSIDPSQLESIDEVDQRWKWTDSEQVKFREVKRIDVSKDPVKAGEMVTEARINGMPIVLVGHVGWANFAKRWIQKKKPEEKQGEEAEPITASATKKVEGTENKGNDLLDLSDPSNILDIERMMNDIGDEDVPVVKRNYNESDPIHGVIPASRFFKACWPNNVKSDGTILSPKKDDECDPAAGGGTSGESSASNPPKLYLHQWQFPLSDTAGRKLCHNNNPLPPEILGEDLLKHWIDLPQCKSDSPLQYLFMGREETMSKLHKDAGGLAISIAPIVGLKECVLVHRSDGSNCMYHLSASLADIDLDSFPLLSQARIWRTVIKPGEILLMPQGTYHQCRNVTPCLSYSRFYLDTVNLLPFFQSLVDGDAPELEHEEVLWNSTTELIRTVDSAVDDAQARVKRGETSVPKVDASLARIVDTLRALRNIVRELARREELRNAVKGKKAAARRVRPGGHVTLPPAKDGAGMNENRTSVAMKQATDNGSMINDHGWENLVGDIDLCMHEFRFRRMEKIPTFRARRIRALKNALNIPHSGKEGAERRKGTTKGVGSNDVPEEGSSPVVAYDTDLDKAYLAIRNASAKYVPSLCESEEGKKTIMELAVGDHIHARIEGKRIPAEIIQIDPDQHSAYLSYEDYPSLYDEYQPYEQLRKPLSYGDASEIPHGEVKPGLVVLNRWGEKREV
mmetsp:Transcript_37883/g.55509  ORF Transcript_37883/g.55509 Transcript_37883/m.55509 type:complete len:935 (+) Transcript_37883:92-2896(+)